MDPDRSVTSSLLFEDRLREELERARPQVAAVVTSAEQLEVLQARLQAMHTAKLLTKEELGSLEDSRLHKGAANGRCQCEGSRGGSDASDGMLSERMQADGSFARQLRRKFVAKQRC